MKSATVNANADVNHEDVKTLDRIMSHVETPAQRELFDLLRTLITVRAMNKARGANANPA